MNKLTLKAQRGVDWFLAVVLCSCDVANGMMHREYPWFLLSPGMVKEDALPES